MTASRYRRSPRASAGGASAALAVLAGIVALLVAVPGHAPGPAPAQRAMTLFDVDRPSPRQSAARARQAQAVRRDTTPSPIAKPAPPQAQATHAEIAPAAPPAPAAAPLRPSPPPIPLQPEAPAPPPPAPPARDTGAVRDRYAAALWQAIRARRPRGVHIPGTARIAFRVEQDGNIADLSLQSPSGNAMLDRMALRTVARAAPFPAPPQALGNALAFTIDVHFD